MAPIDNFSRATARWPDRSAVEISHVDRIEQISYAKLADTVRAVVAGPKSTDPNPQSRVGICADNHFEHLLGWLGCFAAGKVWLPLNPLNG